MDFDNQIIDIGKIFLDLLFIMAGKCCLISYKSVYTSDFDNGNLGYRCGNRLHFLSFSNTP